MVPAPAKPSFRPDFALLPALGAYLPVPTKRWYMAALAIALACSSTVQAQYHFYPRRGTVFSNDVAALAEYRMADGQYALDYMRAYRLWIEAEHERLKLDYDRYQLRQLVLARESAGRQERIDARRERQRANALKSQGVEASGAGGLDPQLAAWPQSLQRARYASSIQIIQSIMQNGHLSEASSARWAERAIAAEAGVMRAKLLADSDLTAGQRDEALTMLELVSIRARALAITTTPAATLAASDSEAAGSVRGASIPQ